MPPLPSLTLDEIAEILRMVSDHDAGAYPEDTHAALIRAADAMENIAKGRPNLVLFPRADTTPISLQRAAEALGLNVRGVVDRVPKSGVKSYSILVEVD